MKLSKILENIQYKCLYGNIEVDCIDIQIDHRKIDQYSSIFIALPGTKDDGNNYINEAIKNGASVIVSQQDNHLKYNDHITYVVVDDILSNSALIIRNFFDNPSEHIQVIAAVGTSGKTSLVNILFQMFRNMNQNVGLISSLTNNINDEVEKAWMTTPSCLDINRYLSKMVKQNCKYCFMEATSHAIVQHRLDGIKISIAIFLNISDNEHLDYHKTFQNYINAKQQLFNTLPKDSVILYNMDDKHSQYMIQNSKAHKYSCSIKQTADFHLTPEYSLEGSFMKLYNRKTNLEFYSLLIGEVNAYNVLFAYTVAHLLGYNDDDIIVSLSLIKPIPGRMNVYHYNDYKLTGIIDYAHTPVAFETVLSSIVDITKNNRKNIIVVFGCGGERDKSKRGIMTKIAYKYCDWVILTEDNSRSENVEDIFKDMISACSQEELQNIRIIKNREEAIKFAIQLAKPNDVIVLLGKGVDNYQDEGDKKYYFSDKETLENNLHVMGSRMFNTYSDTFIE